LTPRFASSIIGVMSTELTPRFSFAIGMVYVTAADGHLGETERFELRRVVPDAALIERAMEYCRSTSPVDFLARSAPTLSREQKLSLLLNMADVSMTDGEIASEERDLLDEFQRAFDISEEKLAPFLECLAIKNDRQIFPA
jgi:uncharacterized tellurite resistance protein B-like protein